MPKTDKRQAPVIDGLVGTRPVQATWLGRAGRSWDYHAPADCRPMGRRVSVHMWDDGGGSYVSAIEGDGRKPGFAMFERVTLPDGAGDDEAAAVASELAARYLSRGRTDAVSPENVVAGMLVRAGFVHDDFMGSQAWQKPAEAGFVYFIRAEPEPKAVTASGGATFVVGMPMPLADPEGPVQVGLLHETELGMMSTVAPSLEEAIEVAETDRMPRPDPGEETEIEFASLFGRRPGAR